MLSFQRHRDLFRAPELRATVAASIAGRMPIGIAGLAILLFVQGRSGSFVLAGTVSALYVLGLALIAPFLGRLIDRLGPRPVLLVCAVLYPAGLLGLTALVLLSAHPAWVCAMSLLAGATMPPISACVRALYPRMVPDPALLHTAYSVDSALVELVFILGPALVAVCVALGHAEAALLLAAFSAAAGTFAFMRAPPIRRWGPARVRADKDWLGALRYPKLLVVFGTTLLYALAFGLFEVAVTAQAAGKGVPAAAGVTLALVSVGSGAGALVYGARHWRAPLRLQFATALATMAAGVALLIPIDDMVLYAAASVVTGIPMATVIATQSLLVSRLASRERLAESFAWSVTCLLAGISTGIAAGGVLAEQFAPYWLLVAAVAMTAAAALVAATCVKEESR